MPRDVEPGMEVISGCINQTGILTIQTSKEFGESTVSKILDLVENASDKKGKTENFISRFARYYTRECETFSVKLTTIRSFYDKINIIRRAFYYGKTKETGSQS